MNISLKNRLSAIAYHVLSKFIDLDKLPGITLTEKGYKQIEPYYRGVKRFIKAPLIRTTTLQRLYDTQLNKNLSFPSETITTSDISSANLYPKWHVSPEYHDLIQDSYSTPESYSLILEDVIYCPKYEIILTPSRQIILDSLSSAAQTLLIKQPQLLDWQKIYDLTTTNISGYCSLFRATHSHESFTMPDPYGHQLLDDLPRIFLLDHFAYKDIDKIQLLYSGSLNSLEEYIIPKIIPKNVVLSSINNQSLYHLEKLIFPSFLNRLSAPYLPSSCRAKYLDALLPKRPRLKKNRIYISRERYATAYTKRHILNEDKLFGELQSFGFEKWQTEFLSLPQQIELFYDAEIVVGTVGSALCSTFFSADIPVIRINPNSPLFPDMYYLAKQVGNWAINYWGDEKEYYVNFSVDVPEIVRLVRECLGE